MDITLNAFIYIAIVIVVCLIVKVAGLFYPKPKKLEDVLTVAFWMRRVK